MPNSNAHQEIAWLATEIRKAIKDCPVKLFCACQGTSDATKFFWPYKLFPVSGARIHPKICDYWILDSNIFDASITNADIMKAEREQKPDWVVPKDYLADPDATFQSVQSFEREYDGRAEILVPLQPPYVKSYERLRRFGGYFAIGSVRDKYMNVDWIRTRNGIVDILKETDCPKIHLFGVSFPEKIIDLVYEDRIVSCDSRTWLLTATMGKYRTFGGQHIDLPQVRGKNVSLAVSQRAALSLLEQALALQNPKENRLGRIAWYKLGEE